MSQDAMTYSSKQMLDKEKLQRLLPKGTSHKVTDEIINLVHSMESDTGLIQDYLEESLLSHLPVLKEIKVDLDDYVNAIKYCNLKRNMTNEKAWEIVFPQRYQKLIKEKRWNSSHVSMYNSSAIVTKIDAQMMISTHIQYAPVFHKNILKLMELTEGRSANGAPVSANVQYLAAAKLVDITAAPIEQKVDIKIGQSDEAKDSQAKMFNAMNTLASNQRELLKAGHKLEDVQKLNIVIDVEEDDDDAAYAEISSD